MKVFISYSHKDSKIADLVVSELESAGHTVWRDKKILKAGDNLVQKLNEGIKSSDAFILLVSRNSLRSKWIMHEYSVIALGDISSKQARVIPVRIDESPIPNYLASRLYIDFQQGLLSGINSLLAALKEPEETRVQIENQEIPSRDYSESIAKLKNALRGGQLTVVGGAGMSIGAGIPSWNDLLLDLLEQMMAQLSDTKTISLKGVNAEEFYKKYGASSLILGKYLKSNSGKDFNSNLRDALYVNNPVTSDIIDSIVELSRPQRDGSPLDSIITLANSIRKCNSTVRA